MGVPLTIVLLLIVALLVGAALNFAAPVVGIPLVVLFLAGLGALEMSRRRRRFRDVQEFREDAKAEKTDFTAEDKKTLA